MTIIKPKHAKLSLLNSAILSSLLLSGCNSTPANPQNKAESNLSFYGTSEPFASEAVYFVMTDRFVDADPSNNYETQGGKFPTFNRELKGEDGKVANVGYIGGDYKGIYQNADYIKSLGFSSVWLTPIVDNPDQNFSGGEEITYGGMFKDGGKTGYHGYWGVNFFEEDEHLYSDNFKFKQYSAAMRSKGLKTVLDIVANHGSPAYTMPEDQAKFGEIYDQDGSLIADHQNLHPTKLDPNNSLHQFYRNEPDLAQLSDTNFENPAVLDYFTRAYLYWIEQGADAFRIDTIRHMPHEFWKAFADNIRAKHPDFFMFGESFVYEADFIAEHTLPENGKVSVLDFPGQKAMTQVFENKDSSFAELESYLYLQQSPYHNPYDLMTFYDNHDMARMNADTQGFINANNWLFTSRGIPVVYYGSEIGFMAGTKEHEGNRNYFGQQRIDSAMSNPIAQALKTIAHVRAEHVALQKGLQLNIDFAKDTAAFYRVYQKDGVNQTALVLLNKANQAKTIELTNLIQPGSYTNAINGETIKLADKLSYQLDANGVAVLILDGVITQPELIAQLKELQQVVPE
ncbi:alpha-amylase family glycosyl hydrolase [Catenovulum sp. 2E275]|uniref:alpha-amylase family glycosyl hydrolase n=1 Tax=Catenovulum sp. 2E275 TaxID=2980497 RepID=UPI0021CFF01A|nr:alpha-amylase family glycosyl hydrolase [Catenovulum sp. 2E275]MCU4676979.1 alpha-amylase family glycosyl hydrolase [Catenovulum sp. 2E275]